MLIQKCQGFAFSLALIVALNKRHVHVTVDTFLFVLRQIGGKKNNMLDTLVKPSGTHCVLGLSRTKEAYCPTNTCGPVAYHFRQLGSCRVSSNVFRPVIFILFAHIFVYFRIFSYILCLSWLSSGFTKLRWPRSRRWGAPAWCSCHCRWGQ